MNELEGFLSEYEDVTRDVSMSDRTTFNTNLARWFELLDESAAIATTIRQLEALVDFPKWLSENEGDGDLGGGTLRWPRGRERLAMQLAAFRWMNADEDNYVKFYGQFNGSSGHYDDMVHDITNQHFDPMARDLRRYLGRPATTRSETEVPASDRLVRLDHNNPDYQQAIDNLDETLEALRGFNDFLDEEEKTTHLAEVNAMRRIFDAFAIRPDVIVSLIKNGLKMLADKFVSTAIAKAASAAFAFIGKFLGMW
jgi:hypothetical protein